MEFKVRTNGFTDIIDITNQVSEIVKNSEVKDGICLVFVASSTCALTTIEYESGVIEDLKRALEIIAPMTDDYKHCKKWGDCNGYAHIRAALIKPSLSLPIEKSKLILGAWQQLVLLDFDNKPRQREILVKVIGK